MFIVPKLLNQFQPKVFHALDGVSIPAYKTQTQYIVTIHDLIPLLYPKFSRTRDALACKYLMPNAMNKSEIILCDSHYIAQQVMDYMPSCSQKVKVIHLGVDLQYFKPPTDKSETQQKLCQLTGIPDQPYILTVVTRSPRRNLNRLLQAFETFLHQSKNDSMQLVIAGGHGWKNKSFMKCLQQHPFKERIHLTGSVSDQTLLWLYQAAKLFAFPSLQEGFGLPVLEAMASGVPVVCSDTTSLAEVGGNAAFTIDPNDTDSIANAILKLTGDQDMYNQLRYKGLERAKEFSWRKTAQKTAEVYQSLL